MRGDRAASLIGVAGAVLLVGLTELCVRRVSLLGLVAVCLPLLLWTLLRAPSRAVRVAAVVCCALAAALALLPVDVWFRKTGRMGLQVRPVAWGLPSVDTVADTLERVESGDVVLGGCLVPANPVSQVVLVTW